jgi:uncharacterized protein
LAEVADDASTMIALVLISTVAAIAYGALGYGFSSIAVPLALLVVSNRELNPAIVLVGVAMNAYALWINRHGLPRVWRRALWVVAGLAPGVALGTAFLTRVDAGSLKLATFGVLLPLILLQTAGFRREIRSEQAAGAVLGTGVGTLYAITTISGPPLAMFLTNQGYTQRDFRAALGLIRLAESVIAVGLYANVGLFTQSSLSLLGVMLPGVVIGVPIGAVLIRRVNGESFRRVCMSFDAVIVAFGLSSLLRSRALVDASVAYLPFAMVVVFVAVILYRFARPDSAKISQCARPQLP